MQAPTFNSEDEEAQYHLSKLRDGTDAERLAAREGLAAIFARRGMFAEAVELYERNIQAGVRTPALFERLSEVYRAIGDHASADAALAEAHKQQLVASATPAPPAAAPPPPDAPGLPSPATPESRESARPPARAEEPAPSPPLPEGKLADDFALDEGVTLDDGAASPLPSLLEPPPVDPSDAPTERPRRRGGRLSSLPDDDGLDAPYAETQRPQTTSAPRESDNRVIPFPSPGAGWAADSEIDEEAWERPRNGQAATSRRIGLEDEYGALPSPAAYRGVQDDESVEPDLLAAAAETRRARTATRRGRPQRRVSGPLFITGVIVFLIIIPVILLALLVVNPIALWLEGRAAGPTIDVQASGPARLKVAPGSSTAWYLQAGRSVVGLWATPGLELTLNEALPGAGTTFTVTPARAQTWGETITIMERRGQGRANQDTVLPAGFTAPASLPAPGAVLEGRIVGQLTAPRISDGNQFSTSAETIDKPVELVVVSSTALWLDRFGNAVTMYFDADRWLLVTIGALLAWCAIAGGAALAWRLRDSAR